ncbi:MAG: nickel pincer cofactor biosynthesis protein LarC [Isosphaeraceae bacterium]|nr:nickel pincer cofactor biosynthesis protein LarC [Isosphaeraceae bacterium]
MRIAYFDCFSGIAGDMTLAALVDAGVDPEAIRSATASLGLPCEIHFDRVIRGGFRATYARVEAAHEHVHRHLHHIDAIIDRGSLTARQVDLAKRIFRRLGEAEAKAHGIPLEKVHFHEVGAVDSIVDIVGAAVGLDLLGVDTIECSPIPTGNGWVEAAHGRMSLPAPATAELLRGIPIASTTIDKELTTPTGAAIAATVVERFGPFPAMTIDSIGLGAGTRELAGQANILRLFVGRAHIPAASDQVWVLETNIDDLPGEIVGYTSGLLMSAGALDAFVTPIQMKKNRPGMMITVLCDRAKIEEMEEILFRETTTLGVRRYPVSRHKLERRAVEVDTIHGKVKGKLGRFGTRPPTFSPEYEDCARVARERGVALREVYTAAHSAYAEAQVPEDASGRAETPGRNDRSGAVPSSSGGHHHPHDHGHHHDDHPHAH